MSVLVPVQGNLQQPVSVKLADTSVNDVLALSVDTTGGITTVAGIIVVNQDTSEQEVSIWWNDGRDDYAIYEGKVAANSTVTVALEVPLVLYTKSAAKKIRAQ